jgi:hypothetical protein
VWEAPGKSSGIVDSALVLDDVVVSGEVGLAKVVVVDRRDSVLDTEAWVVVVDMLAVE